MHLAAIPLIHCAGETINESPGAAGKVMPGNLDEALSASRRKINYNKIACFFFAPAPGDKVRAALVVRPAAALAKLPLTFAKSFVINCRY